MITLAALFMVLFVTAMLWAAFGIGRTIYIREGLQDAADAAAYSAAVFHAKGMNLIALINIIMAALVTVLLVLRMAQTVLQIMAVVFLALSYFGGATAGLAAQAQNSASTINGYFKQAKNIIEPILEGLHGLQEATAAVVPAVALVDGMIEAAKHHPPAEGAFAIPARVQLPIEEDEFSRTCKEAKKMTRQGILQASGINAIQNDELRGLVSAPIDSVLFPLNEITAAFLCGMGDGELPKLVEKMDVRFPRPEGLDSCEKDVESVSCKKAQKELQLSEPSPGSGKCLAQCGRGGPYETLARAARMSCDPRQDGKAKKFRWQERTVRATAVRQQGRWIERDRDEGPLRLRRADRPPCGRGGEYNSDWNFDSGGREQKEPTPLCVQENAPPGGNAGERRVEYIEVVRIFSCVREVEKTFIAADRGDAFGADSRSSEPLATAGTDQAFDSAGTGSSSSSSTDSDSGGETQNSDSDSDDKSPHKVEEGLKMGDDVFQIRAVSFGPQPGPGRNQRLVDLIDRSHENDGSEGAGDGDPESGSSRESGGSGLSEVVTQVMTTVGRISVAQAEYYFAGTSNENDWLWSMEWTARMRRFRISKNENEKDDDRGGSEQMSATSVEDACSGSGGGICEKIQAGLDAMENWIKH